MDIISYILNFAAVKLDLWRFESKSLAIFETPVAFSFAWYAAILFFDYLVLMYGKYKFYLIAFFVGLTIVVFSVAVLEHHLLLER